MATRFGIPPDVLAAIRARDKRCVYCRKAMIFPGVGTKRADWATIEHLNRRRPFNWDEGLRAEHIVICCHSCNSSRGAKKLAIWFESRYCIERNITAKTVADPVKLFLLQWRRQ